MMLDEHDEAEMKDIGTRMGGFTSADKKKMIAIAMKTEAGCEMLKKNFRKYMPPQFADAIAHVMDGNLSPEQVDQFVEDGVLDAMSDGRYTADDARRLLRTDCEDKLSKADIDELKRKMDGR